MHFLMYEILFKFLELGLLEYKIIRRMQTDDDGGWEIPDGHIKGILQTFGRFRVIGRQRERR